MKLTCFLVLGILALGLPSTSPAASASPAVKEETAKPRNQQGRSLDAEVAVYHAHWNGIPIAQAQVRGAPVTVDGKKFYEVKILASTWKYLELIFRMKDMIESVFDPEGFRPHNFVFRQRENGKETDTNARFDSEKMRWSVHRQRGTRVRQFDLGSERTLDPISAVYFARSADFKVGDRLQMEVFGGRSRYLVSLDIEAREAISAMGKTVESYRIVPKVMNLTRSGYAGRFRQATVWISADERRIPLRITSQVFVGNVSIEMVPEKS